MQNTWDLLEQLDREAQLEALKARTRETPQGCWEWLGEQSDGGYGRVWTTISGKSVRRSAHRLAWSIENGPIPEGMLICHKCDNPPCIRPTHLFLGSQEDNMLDATSKGRVGTRLSAEDARRIRNEVKPWSRQGQGITAAAQKYGVSRQTIGAILRGRTWLHC